MGKITNNKLFDRILREAETLYFREDPDSKEAWYSEEPGEDTDVGSSLIFNGKTYDFIWRRKKSNLNFLQHGFTHYLTRYAYADEKKVIEGQKIGKDIVDLNTKKRGEGKIGLLCSMPIEILYGVKIDGYYYKEDDYPLSVLFLVKQEELQSDRVKLVSCFPTDKQLYFKWYSHHYIKERKTIDEFKKEAESLGIPLNKDTIRLFEREDFRRSAQIYNETLEKLRKEMEENFAKGYRVFNEYLKSI